VVSQVGSVTQGNSFPHSLFWALVVGWEVLALVLLLLVMGGVPPPDADTAAVFLGFLVLGSLSAGLLAGLVRAARSPQARTGALIGYVLGMPITLVALVATPVLLGILPLPDLSDAWANALLLATVLGVLGAFPLIVASLVGWAIGRTRGVQMHCREERS
jgi:hypothetical protein